MWHHTPFGHPSAGNPGHAARGWCLIDAQSHWPWSPDCRHQATYCKVTYTINNSYFCISRYAALYVDVGQAGPTCSIGRLRPSRNRSFAALNRVHVFLECNESTWRPYMADCATSSSYAMCRSSPLSQLADRYTGQTPPAMWQLLLPSAPPSAPRCQQALAESVWQRQVCAAVVCFQMIGVYDCPLSIGSLALSQALMDGQCAAHIHAQSTVWSHKLM
jgi:hypothetical protein